MIGTIAIFSPSKPIPRIRDGVYYTDDIVLTINHGRYTYVDDTVLHGKLEKDLEYDNLYYIGEEPNKIYVRDIGNDVLQLSNGLYTDYIWTLDRMDRMKEKVPVSEVIQIEECNNAFDGQKGEIRELFDEKYFKETTFILEGTYTINPDTKDVLCADLTFRNITGKRRIEVSDVSFENQKILIQFTFYRLNNGNIVEGIVTFRFNLDEYE